jgi:hypothetical protein
MTGTPAVFADLLGNFAFSATLGTGRHADELAESRVGSLAHLPGPPAAGTGIQAFGLAAGTTAGSTGLRMHHFDLAIYAGYGILKTDLDAHEEICTGLGPGPSLAPAKEIKDVAKTGEVS